MSKGTIIFLNGVSSSGKSTLVKALQLGLSEPYHCIAQDTFTDIISPWFSGNFNGEDSDKLWRESVSAMHYTIKLYSDIGKNVIVDHVMLKNEGSWEECSELLRDNPVIWVKVDCPLEELVRREKARGDRDLGNAEWQLPRLYPKDGYSIEVDTNMYSIADCAEQIIQVANGTNN